MKRLRPGFLVGMLRSGEYASGEQQGKSDCGHTVHANGSIARWPGEHENVEQSHEFLGPEQSGNSEHQCGLGKNKHVQILHSQKVHSGGAILEIRTNPAWGSHYEGNCRERQRCRPVPVIDFRPKSSYITKFE